MVSVPAMPLLGDRVRAVVRPETLRASRYRSGRATVAFMSQDGTLVICHVDGRKFLKLGSAGGSRPERAFRLAGGYASSGLGELRVAA